MVFVQPNIVSEQPKGDFLHLKNQENSTGLLNYWPIFAIHKASI